jgi:DNA-binding transcriptional MocR family regulator
MSHRATNWAIQQRGLAPATKLVLWHLCDRHYPDYGCFPSQDQLAADAEISRASLNTHLDKLEQAGLIRRERRHSEGAHRRQSTRYFLAFEPEFSAQAELPLGPENRPKRCPESRHGNRQKPCPDFAKIHVQNLDTNLVSKEPVNFTARDAGATREGRAEASIADHGLDLDEAEAACLAACGEGMAATARAAITATTATIGAWLAAGYDLELDVLPVIAERTAKP